MHYSNLLWVLLDLIPVIWHDALLRIPVMRSASTFASNGKRARSFIYGTDYLSSGGSFTDILIDFIFDASVNDPDQTRYLLNA